MIVIPAQTCRISALTKLYLATLVIFMSSNAAAEAVPALPSCPARPNCVSSQATDSHHILPFKVTEDARFAFQKLRKLLTQRRDTKLISSDDTIIRVEFRTSLGFVDDGLFLMDSANGLIHIRSAARLGYWDLGKNRSRMEEIRKSFAGVHT